MCESFEIRSPQRFAGWVAIACASVFVGPGVVYALVLGQLAMGVCGCGFLALWFAGMRRFTRVRVVADAGGLLVDNGTIRRRLPWSDVDRLHLHATTRRTRAVEVWLANNESLILEATTRRSSPQVEAFLVALESWLPPRRSVPLT